MNLEINKPNIKESDVKKKVKEIIRLYSPAASIYMPVGNGMGSANLDFICSVNGYYFAVETKIAGKRPTRRQIKTIDDLIKSGAIVLIIDELNLAQLKNVLIQINQFGEYSAKFWANIHRIAYFKRAEENNYRV